MLGDIIKTIGNTIKEVVKTVTGATKNSSSSSSSSTSKSSSSSSSGSSSKSSSSSGSSSGSSSSSSSSTVVLVDPLVGVIFDVSSSEAAYWLNSGCVRLDDGGEFVFGNIINTSKYADKINIAAGSNVTITNQKDRKIGTINTGDNSNTTVNNRGIIDTINTGKDSSLTLNNYEGGQVGKITGGDISNKDSQLGINVTNYGHIDHIQTGVNSTNEVFNYDGGYVDWLETGFGNASFHSDGFGNITGAGSDYNISKDKEGIDAYMVDLKKYIGKFGTFPQGKLDEIGKTLNKYKNTKGPLEYFIKELQATGKITVTQDKISGKYKVNNKEKTYYEIYYEQIMNTPNNSLYAINVPEEYGRFVFAAHKAGIPDQDIMGIEDWVNTNGPIWKATYNDRSVQATKEAVSIILGFTPVDIFKDTADLIAGKDIITGRESNRVLLALCLISPELFDKLLKGGLKQSDLFAEAAVEAGTAKYVNLASEKNTRHILFGDATGGGHIWPGAPNKTPFPEGWSGEKIMHEVSDIVTDPALKWEKNRVIKGVQRYEVTGVRNGTKIKVITDGKDIITAYPVK